MRTIKKTECFKIKVIENDLNKINKITEMINGDVIFNISCSKSSPFYKEPLDIVADPFLFCENNRLYLFYEQKKMYEHGVISMVYTDDLIEWSIPVTVLEEKCHLSYPYIFKMDDDVYMIPETSELGEIRLYKAIDVKLTKFEFVKTLIKQGVGNVDISFSDSSFLFMDDMVYLFTTVTINGINELTLFYSDNIFGPFIKHPNSPICLSNKYGRNAGGVIKCDEKIIRLAQDCDVRYGENVHIFEIIKINNTEYKEKLIHEYIFDKNNDFHREGGHHVSYVEFKNRVICAVDGKEYHNFLWSKILHKLGLFDR